MRGWRGLWWLTGLGLSYWSSQRLNPIPVFLWLGVTLWRWGWSGPLILPLAFWIDWLFRWPWGQTALISLAGFFLLTQLRRVINF